MQIKEMSKTRYVGRGSPFSQHPDVFTNPEAL